MLLILKNSETCITLYVFTRCMHNRLLINSHSPVQLFRSTTSLRLQTVSKCTGLHMKSYIRVTFCSIWSTTLVVEIQAHCFTAYIITKAACDRHGVPYVSGVLEIFPLSLFDSCTELIFSLKKKKEIWCVDIF